MGTPFKMTGFSGYGNGSPLRDKKTYSTKKDAPKKQELEGWKGEFSESDYKEFSNYETARTTGVSTGGYSGYSKDAVSNQKKVKSKMGGGGAHMAAWGAMTKKFKDSQ